MGAAKIAKDHLSPRVKKIKFKSEVNGRAKINSKKTIVNGKKVKLSSEIDGKINEKKIQNGISYTDLSVTKQVTFLKNLKEKKFGVRSSNAIIGTTFAGKSEDECFLVSTRDCIQLAKVSSLKKLRQWSFPPLPSYQITTPATISRAENTPIVTSSTKFVSSDQSEFTHDRIACVQNENTVVSFLCSSENYLSKENRFTLPFKVHKFLPGFHHSVAISHEGEIAAIFHEDSHDTTSKNDTKGSQTKPFFLKVGDDDFATDINLRKNKKRADNNVVNVLFTDFINNKKTNFLIISLQENELLYEVYQINGKSIFLRARKVSNIYDIEESDDHQIFNFLQWGIRDFRYDMNDMVIHLYCFYDRTAKSESKVNIWQNKRGSNNQKGAVVCRNIDLELQGNSLTDLILSAANVDIFQNIYDKNSLIYTHIQPLKSSNTCLLMKKYPETSLPFSIYAWDLRNSKLIPGDSVFIGDDLEIDSWMSGSFSGLPPHYLTSSFNPQVSNSRNNSDEIKTENYSLRESFEKLIILSFTAKDVSLSPVYLGRHIGSTSSLISLENGKVNVSEHNLSSTNNISNEQPFHTLNSRDIIEIVSTKGKKTTPSILNRGNTTRSTVKNPNNCLTNETFQNTIQQSYEKRQLKELIEIIKKYVNTKRVKKASDIIVLLQTALSFTVKEILSSTSLQEVIISTLSSSDLNGDIANSRRGKAKTMSASSTNLSKKDVFAFMAHFLFAPIFSIPYCPTLLKESLLSLSGDQSIQCFYNLAYLLMERDYVDTPLYQYNPDNLDIPNKTGIEDYAMWLNYLLDANYFKIALEGINDRHLQHNIRSTLSFINNEKNSSNNYGRLNCHVTSLLGDTSGNFLSSEAGKIRPGRDITRSIPDYSVDVMHI